LLYHHYPTIDSEQATFPRKESIQREEQQLSDRESSQEEKETSTNSVDIAPNEGEREGGECMTDLDESVEVVTVHQAATQTLDFLKPFLEELHSEYSSSKV
jgi:hypothetical protein